MVELIKIQNFIFMMRIRQWYKNLIIFLGLVYGLELLSFENLSSVIFGFAALCIITSAGYIRNDIIDLESDKVHPEKNKRPLPSGVVTLTHAYSTFFVLLIGGLCLSFFLDLWFFIIIIALIVNTEIYSRILKKYIFLDVFSIGINFIIRAVSGILLIKTPISPWIILGVFFVALFLGFIKRKSEFITLKNFAGKHRKVLENYTIDSLNSSILISAIMIITTYSLYAIIGPFNDHRLILTVPFVVFIILKQIHLSNINHILIQKNEFFKEKLSLAALLIFSLFTLLLLYTKLFDVVN